MHRGPITYLYKIPYVHGGWGNTRATIKLNWKLPYPGQWGPGGSAEAMKINNILKGGHEKL
jgi:hypothetical protein